ncbi:hypothetical protein Tco_1062772 [Tanacetum coccineum]
MFATMVEHASGATTKDVHLAGQATASPAKGEKNTNLATTDAEPNLHDELVDLLGIDVVTYDLHMAKWREVVQACPGRKEKGWKTINGLIKTRMEYLDQTKKELKINFNKPLKEQDPLNELMIYLTRKGKEAVTQQTILGQQRNTSHQFNMKKSLCSGTETKEGLWKELQFSLVDNSKLSVVTSLKPEFSKLLASHDFASCLPNALKELPSKFTELSGEIKELKKHVAELKNIQWKLPAEFQALPSQVSSVQEKLKNLDSLPSLLNKVTDTLNMFASVVENASGATTKDVPSASQVTTSPAKGEKNTNPTTTDTEPNLHDELVDLLGIDVVTQYYNKKLLYDKYCENMLKRRKSSKITSYDVLTQKGPILLKVHREDRTNEVISNVKVSDLHLTEWREVVKLS